MAIVFGLENPFFWPKVIFGFINPLALRVSRKVSKVRRQILYLAHIARSRIQEVYFWSSGQKLSDVHSNSEFCWDFTFTFVHYLSGTYEYWTKSTSSNGDITIKNIPTRKGSSCSQFWRKVSRLAFLFPISSGFEVLPGMLEFWGMSTVIRCWYLTSVDLRGSLVGKNLLYTRFAVLKSLCTCTRTS